MYTYIIYKNMVIIPSVQKLTFFHVHQCEINVVQTHRMRLKIYI